MLRPALAFSALLALGRPCVGGEIACQCGAGADIDIYLMNADGTGKVRLTDWRGEEGHPAFSPDGKRLAFHANVAGSFEIYVMDLSSRKATRLTRDPATDIEPAWSRDGKTLYFTSDRSGRNEIYLVDVKSQKVTHVFGKGGASTQEADPSPDGSAIAFTQSGSVPWRWHVGLFERSSKTSRILTDAGSCRPSWSPDGRSLYFTERRGGSHALVRLDVASLKKEQILSTPGTSYYDVRVSPDGRKLAFQGHPHKRGDQPTLYVTPIEGATPRPIAEGCAYPDWRR